MILCSCPECGYRYKVADDLAGKTVLCPECKTRLKVPSRAPASAEDVTKKRFRAEEPARDGRQKALPWILAASGTVLGLAGIIVAVLVATRRPATQVAGMPAPVAPPEAPKGNKESTEAQEKAEVARKTQAERQRKAEKEAEPAQKADAQKKAAAWLADRRTQLLKAQEQASTAKESARKARERAEKAREAADQASEQAAKDYRIYQGARAVSKFYQEYMKEDRQAARSKELAKQRTKEARTAEQDAGQAEETARQAAAAVAEAQAAVRQAETVYYSLGGVLPAEPAQPRSARPKVAEPQLGTLFVGRWKLVDDKGVVSSYLTVKRDGTAKRDHAPDSPGTWEVVGNDARLAWEDSFRDIMRLENDGKVTVFGLGRKATSWESQPLFQLEAIRISTESQPVIEDESDEALERAGLLTRDPSGKTVSVRGYYRRDGTYVAPHTRAAPSQGAGKAKSRASRGRR